MQKTMKFKKLCSLCLCIVLIATIALFTTGCTNNAKTSDGNISVGNLSAGSIASEEIISLGQGERNFTFCVGDVEGKETYYSISTDKTTVGEALMELELIDGEVGMYGIYVKTVNGITLDYDKDGMYWAFYVDTEISPTGADMTEIIDGEIYRFVATEG